MRHAWNVTVNIIVHSMIRLLCVKNAKQIIFKECDHFIVYFKLKIGLNGRGPFWVKCVIDGNKIIDSDFIVLMEIYCNHVDKRDSLSSSTARFIHCRVESSLYYDPVLFTPILRPTLTRLRQYRLPIRQYRIPLLPCFCSHSANIQHSPNKTSKFSINNHLVTLSS